MFFIFTLLVANAFAASTPVATSPIISTITSTYFSTTSSVTGSSLSESIGTSVSCSISGTVSLCLVDAAVASMVPLYGTDVIALTTQIVSTIGYTTIYNDVAEEGSNNAPTTITTNPIASPASSASDSDTNKNTRTSSKQPSQDTGSGANGSAASQTAKASTTTDPNVNSNDDSTPNEPSTLGRNIGIAIAIAVGVLFGGCGAILFFRKRQEKKSSIVHVRDEEKHNQGTIQAKLSTGTPSTASLAPQTSSSGTGGEDPIPNNGPGQGLASNSGPGQEDHEQTHTAQSGRVNDHASIPTGGGPGAG